MIDIKDVSFSYGGKDGKALNQVSLHISKGECVLLTESVPCTGKTISATIMQSVTNNTFFFSVFQHPCATCIFCIIHICLRAQSTLLVLVIDKYVNNIYCHASLKYNISKLMF